MRPLFELSAAERREQQVRKRRAEMALERTASVGGRGPRTILCRQLLMDWLEGKAPATARDIEAAAKWLFAVAEQEAER